MPTSVCSPLGFISLSKGGQHRSAQEKRDDHAAARNQAELGQPGIIRRHEGKETSGRRERGQGQGWPHALARARQGLFEVSGCVTLGAVANRILDSEIDSDADEQRNEGDGDDVEGAKRGDGERGGDRQPREKRQQNRDNDLR